LDGKDEVVSSNHDFGYISSFIQCVCATGTKSSPFTSSNADTGSCTETAADSNSGTNA